MEKNLSGTAARSIRALFTAGTVGALSDAELLDRFAARDGDRDEAETAFAGLVERHGPTVLRVCKAVLRDVHDAEDAVQATFVILALKAGSIRRSDALASWLYSVAYNVATTARVSGRRRRTHESNAARSRAWAVTDSDSDDLGAVILEELDRMPHRYRTVLLLCCVEGLTMQQAAGQLGRPLGTVKSRLARGRELLRARLARRGLAPSPAVMALESAGHAAPAALPTALARSTVRLAVTIAAARPLGLGGAPAAVMRLAKSVMRAMFLGKLATAGAAALLAAAAMATGAAVYGRQTAAPERARATKDAVVGFELQGKAAAGASDGLLRAAGVVRLRDGSPVAGAILRSTTGSDEPSTTARADESGRFALEAVFGNGCRLHVMSPDGRFQTVLKVRAVETRLTLAAPLEVTLLPALSHEVTVLSQGQPAAGARVAAIGTDFQVEGITGPDGKVRLRVPAKERITEVVAWHPTLGVFGKQNLDERAPEGATELSLLAPAPHTIRVIDERGNSVGNLDIELSVRTDDSDWISAGSIEASRVRTDATGTATVPWAPREKLQVVDVRPISPEWKVNEADFKEIKAGRTTLHVRRERAVRGRLIMPEGASGLGILISGFGFGPAGRGDIPYARASRDGTFFLRVPSEHGFVLGIADLKWASDGWKGEIIGNGPDKPAEIAIRVYPATPLVVRVTRGPRREPMANVWIDLETRREVKWTDRGGKERSGFGGVGTWLSTDANGVARAGLGKGEHGLRMVAENWEEEKSVRVNSDAPVEVEFHRGWIGKRRITGRLLRDGKAFAISPSVVARAWQAESPVGRPAAFEPVTHPDGSFEVMFDAEAATLLFVDREHGLSGYAGKVQGDSVVDVTLAPTATYAGTLVDDKGQAVAGRVIEIIVKGSGFKPVANAQTDNQGRFRFTGVPAGMALHFRSRYQGDDLRAYIQQGERTFEPGERRDDDRLTLHREQAPS